jgi:predicted nucleic acid-binding protein
MNVSLDASAIVPLFVNDVFTERAKAFLIANTPALVISDFGAAEFASVIARRVRTRDLTESEARSAFSTFDIWSARFAQRIETLAADMVAASVFMRRLDLNLRTPDALNIAIAQRVAATLVTFGEKMAANARLLGVPVASA